jgi:hypothetical protein
LHSVTVQSLSTTLFLSVIWSVDIVVLKIAIQLLKALLEASSRELPAPMASIGPSFTNVA